MNLVRTSRYFYLKFIRLTGEPRSLAGGTAIGVFFGITPITPLHTLTNIIVTLITGTSTAASLLASVIVCNPFTYIPQYFLSMIIGEAVTPYDISWESLKNILDTLLAKQGFIKSLEAIADFGYEAVIVLLVGGVILAAPFTVASYFLSLKLFVKIKNKRRRKHVLS